ncbi:MAG TPA: LuxR C-terminal-related transcriptional regulator [Actinomycetota bacterium]|nr:LuxR C-terminal-related transcriptional regulator [Actinomycetota bacterium]
MSFLVVEPDPSAPPGRRATHSPDYPRVVAAAVSARGGRVTGCTDGSERRWVGAFTGAADAVAAALELHVTLRAIDAAAAMALDAGDVEVDVDGGYRGRALDRCLVLAHQTRAGHIVASASVAALTSDRFEYKDLGPHRLWEGQPERVFQLLHPDMDEADPLDRTGSRTPTNLPTQATSFVGRDDELRRIRGLLGSARLITLLGPGGSGKTRLAVRAATEAAPSHPDGVWFVDLSGVAPGEDPAQAVASTLGLRGVAGLQPMDRLVAHLEHLRCLIILDNCEQVVEASAEVAGGLAERCPGVTVMATSRAALDLPGGHVLRVPPLQVPAPGEPIERAEAVRLFCDRASSVRDGFRLSNANAAAVAEICRRLDGIPLAIELAAGRVNTLSPDQIAAGLDDRFKLLAAGAPASRQRTLEGSVEWSYSLLDDQEKGVLRRTSVFAGGFALREAERVCAAEGFPPSQVLDVIARLVDRSLIASEEAPDGYRYRLLETIREFAQARLMEAGDADACRREHAETYVELASRLLDLSGSDPDAAIAAARTEIPNLVAAYEWCIDERAPGDALRIACLLAFALSRSAAQRSIELVRRALAAAPDAPMLLRAVGHLALGHSIADTTDFAEALRVWDEGRALARSAGAPQLAAAIAAQSAHLRVLIDPLAAREAATQAVKEAEAAGAHMALESALIAWSTYESFFGSPVLAHQLNRRALEEEAGRGSAGEALAAECWRRLAFVDGVTEVPPMVRQRRETTDRIPASRASADLFEAWAAEILGEVAEARALWARAVRSCPDGYLMSLTLLRAGRFALGDGRLETGIELLLRAEEVAPKQRVPVTAALMTGVALAAMASGDAASARAQLERAIDYARRQRLRQELGEALLELGRLDLSEGDPLAAQRSLREAASVAATIGDNGVGVQALEALARAASAEDRPGDAVRLLGAANAARSALGYAPMPDRAAEIEACIALTRGALGDEAFERAWTHGSSTPLEDVLASEARGRGPRGRPASGWDSLTPAELAVVRQAAHGRSNKEIGAILHLSPRTVQNHLSRVFGKLGISSRAELAALAATRHLPGED